MSISPGNGSPGEVIVRAERLTKRYGTYDAVHDMSFDVRRGEILGFLGPNGSGKSTTIAMLLSLIRPTSGTVTLFDLPANRYAEGLQRIGAIIESPAFYPYMSGRDNLQTLATLRPGVPDSRVEEVLTIVGLIDAAGQRFREYSLGMKQRLGIAWTLLADPDMLILDEPTNGLDPAGQAELRDMIRDLSADGKTVFISSHQLKDIQEICTRVIIIKKGQFIVEGTISDLLGKNLRLLVRTSEPERALDLVRNKLGIAHVELSSGALVIEAPDLSPGEINRELVLAGVTVEELRPAGSLEEVFLELTSSHDQTSA
jgi:ABC-2 type transport system ATP-binding protein